MVECAAVGAITLLLVNEAENDMERMIDISLFEYKPVDKDYYEREIKDFLPSRVIDVHSHVYSREFRDPAYVDEELEGRSQSWPGLVAQDNPIEDLKETYRVMFPDKAVTPVIFGMPTLDYFMDKNNDYIAKVSRDNGYPAFMLTHPGQTAGEIKKGLSDGGFVGVKVYLEFAPSYIPGNEIRIFDYAPHHQLEVLSELKMAMMLHIPRPGRLRDAVNIAQMLEIDRKYPGIKLIIAHVGRAYAIEDVGDALDRLKDSNMVFDISANTNQQVLEEALDKIGPRRILFGSDLPIVRMRMKRVTENGKYINLVRKGSYGDVSDDPHMREIEGEQADALSFFMYEIISAMRRACEAKAISRRDAEAIFFSNAAELLGVE